MIQKYNMIKEIGSEFWIQKNYNDNHNDNIFQVNEFKKNTTFLLSGRTAIDYAIHLIEKKMKVNSVYMPSYCCNSMLTPFLEKNIKIEFYTVLFDGEKFIYDIDCDKKCDIFFAMNYFGFTINNMDYYIDMFKTKNSYVIEDATHSLLSKRKYNIKSDLVVASLRKWFPIISGGILIANNNECAEYMKDDIENLKHNEIYIPLKQKAMLEKNIYINQRDDTNKEEVLNKFKNANHILDIDYKSYKIDTQSYEILHKINLQEVIQKRRNNTKIIYDYLKNQKTIKYVKDINIEEDCPLFIPIFLKKNKRDNVKKYLVGNKIYCPNHWPIPDLITDKNQKEIYNMELSLICDQRYSEKEMEKETNTINYFFEEKEL